VHIYVDSRAPWHTIQDDLPRFAQAASEEFFAPFVEAAASGPKSG
jgi:hypothetical protein